MKIAIDVSPLSSMSKVRGVGFYLKNLLHALKTYYPEHEYLEFTTSIPKEADVVHYPYFDPFSLTLPLFTNKKIVVTVHDLTPLVLPNLFPVGVKGKLFWYLQKRNLRNVKRIITDSQASKKDIIRLAGTESSKIDPIYLAAGEHFNIQPNKNVLQEVSKKYNLPKNFFLYVGDATPNKNLTRLVRASLQTTTPLVMVGKTLADEAVPLNHPWTKDIAEVRLYAKDHPDKIRLVGFVGDEELDAFYHLASALVMPSLYEGFGLPVVEGYATGCPVITSDRGSLKEIATRAFVVDPESIESIAQGMQKIIGDRQLQKKMSEKGLLVSKQFSWKKTAKETLESYKKALL